MSANMVPSARSQTVSPQVSWRLLGDGDIPEELHCTIEGHSAFRRDGVRAAITDCLWVIIGPCECVTDTQPALAWPAPPLLSAAQAIERAAGSAAAAAAAVNYGAHAVLMRSTDFRREIRDRLASPSGTPRAAGLRCQRSLDGADVTHHIHGHPFRLVTAGTWEVRTSTDRPWRVYRAGGTWYLTEQPRPARRPRAQLLGAGSSTAALAAAAERIHQITQTTARATA